MGGHPQSFSPRNASDSAGATREQVLGESTSNSPMVEASSVAGLENTNPSKPIEINSDILGDVPIFQEVDNMDRERRDYVQDENSIRMEQVSAFQDDDVEQPPGLEINEVATGKPIDVVIGSDCSRLNQEEGQAVANNLKPKSTWTRINRMDFGLGGLSKA